MFSLRSSRVGTAMAELIRIERAVADVNFIVAVFLVLEVLWVLFFGTFGLNRRSIR